MAYDLAMGIESNDLIILDGDLMLIDNAERVAQQIAVTLRFWRGEWFLDTQDGAPYLEHVLVKAPNIAHIRQIFAERIKSVEGVRSLVSLDLQYDKVRRTLDVKYSADTNYGLLTRKEVLGYGD